MGEMLAAGVGSFWSPARGSYGSWSCWGATFNWSVIGDNKGNEATTCQSQSGHRLVTSSKLIPSGVHLCWTIMAQINKSDIVIKWRQNCVKESTEVRETILIYFLTVLRAKLSKIFLFVFLTNHLSERLRDSQCQVDIFAQVFVVFGRFLLFFLYIYLMRLCVRVCWYFLTDVVGRLRRQRRIL